MKSSIIFPFAALCCLMLLSACGKVERKTVYPDYWFNQTTVIRNLDNDCLTNLGAVSEQLDHFGEYVVSGVQVSRRDEERYAEEVHGQIAQHMGGSILTSGKAHKRVQKIFERMKPFLPQGYTYHAYVLDANFVNAFCTGPRFYCTLPLVNLMTDDELAGIIGHELGHHTNGHIKQHIQSRRRFGAALSSLSSMVSVGLHQIDELESDCTSAYFCYEAGYDPKSINGAFAKFQRMHPEEYNWLFRLLSTHPPAAQRMACVDQYVDDCAKEALNHGIEVDIIPIFNLIWATYKTPISIIIGMLLLILGGIYWAYRHIKYQALVGGFFVLALFTSKVYNYYTTSINWVKKPGIMKHHFSNDNNRAFELKASPDMSAETIYTLRRNNNVKVLFAGNWDKINGHKGRWLLVTYYNNVNAWVWGYDVEI
jgi:hypothetical protein